MRFSIWMAGLLLVGGVVLAADETVTSKVDRLNVRAGQSTKAAVVAKLASGQKVTAFRANADWVEIAPSELYIARSLLKDGKTTGKVNLRSGPGANFPAFGRTEANYAVKVLDDGKGEWVKIAPPPGVAGYVARSMVNGDLAKLPKLEGAAAPAPAKSDDKKADAKDDKTAEAPAKAEPKKSESAKSSVAKSDDMPFDDLPVVAGSGKEVTVTGDFLPIKSTGGVKFALAVAKGGEYDLQYFIHVGDAGKKFDSLAKKRVRIVGVSYKVEGWKTPVLKPAKITPIETR